ncbi:Putative pyridoxal phosphate-dependent aminotransferase EpsN [Pirellula sp. SH-Sr6A]|uniref:LegC family aminotransferase n=1 Tax=Pirellula sp. SH-Sr6A TaxID=1632865 RepID=UPI00078E7424|nr:LegC family aminotransferase [Pirellula sp. SH-Sr6A]AMV31854.1 Putative pyridoxal phosphate-dependent aminotransferase EpsN [Pirellula sp. SH-Sr6A]
MNLAQQIVARVEQAIGRSNETILLHRPYFPPSTNRYVQECVDTGWVSSAGSYVTRFEQLLAQTTGAKRAVATVNGTAALEMCFRLAGVQSGDEVLAPSLTFVATANAIHHCGAIPHFVDVSVERLSICPEALRRYLQAIATTGSHGKLVNRQTGRRIGALCVMHCFGHPAALDDLLAICREFDLTLIEDAAESLGSYYRGSHTGRLGLLSAVSFNGNKIVTTGGGGAILTDDEQLADLAKHVTTTAKVPHRWEFHHDRIGWNFRMPNINAALGVAQLEIFSQLLAAKRELKDRYERAFGDLEPVTLLSEPSDGQSNYWLNGFRIPGASVAERDAVLDALNSAGYQSRPIWEPMHQLPMFANSPRDDLPRTEQLKGEIVNIPSSADLVPSHLLEAVTPL